MGNPSVDFVVKSIEANPNYEIAFRKIFDEGITMGTIGQAFAAYQHTLIAADSPADRYLYAGDNDALSESEKNGYGIFYWKNGVS